MVLTEPDAGSDVGAGRTKAMQNDDGTWTITGVKRFITSAESDMVDNVVHFVLARPEGAGPGTKGLSLFILPKYAVDLETGELGERNGVYVTNVEKKMGLKVSTTCELTFGGERPAVGTLLGDVHDGIAQMFHVIENARMMVGTKAIATLSTGYLNALDYAKERVQGADLTQATDKTAPRVTITHHPDVRRSLMTAEGVRRGPAGARALHREPAGHRRPGAPRDGLARTSRRAPPPTSPAGSTTCCCRSSRAWAPSAPGCSSAPSRCRPSAAPGSSRTTRSSSTSATPRSTPSTRARPRSRAWTSSSARSSRDKGQALTHLSTQIQEFAKDLGAHGGRLDRDRELLGQGLEDVQGILGFMVGELMKSDPRNGGEITNVYTVGQNTTRLLLGAGDLVVGWLLLRQAAGGARRPRGRCLRQGQGLLRGQGRGGAVLARQVLPRLSAERADGRGHRLAPHGRARVRPSGSGALPERASDPDRTRTAHPARGGPFGIGGATASDADAVRAGQRGSTSVRSTREPVTGSTWLSRVVVKPARRRRRGRRTG